jgi:hypothetical protein
LKLLSFILSLFTFACLSSSVQSQDINNYVSVSEPADWVENHSNITSDFTLGKDEETQYLLVDIQKLLLPTETVRYFHYVDKLLSPKSVEQNSTLKISFDPAYQKITMHHARLIRDGVEKDILDLAGFDIYRYETDREKLIYNGALEISYPIPDVRVGDVLNYAFTISGKNPAFGRHINSGFRHQYGVPAQRMFQRLLLQKDADVDMRSFVGAIAPTKAVIGNYDTYTWDRTDVPALLVDDNIPDWHRAYPETQISSLKNWAEVGQHFSKYYKSPEVLTEPLQKIVNDIRQVSDNPKYQMRAALDFVQREIRYLGIELGAGGFIPRSPSKVLSRRFGDCKDMTLLLVTILNSLDIQASPLLVDLNDRSHIEDNIPSYAVFDHVIVMATFDGTNYFLDPTSGQQLGTLDVLNQGSFGKGVVISPNSPGMVDANPPTQEFLKNIVDTYDIVSDPETVTLTSVSSYYRGQADSMTAWYTDRGIAGIEKSFLEFYQNTHPSITQTAPIKIETFSDQAKIVFTAKYEIPKAWETEDNKKVRSFYARAGDIRHDLPNFVGSARTSPFPLSHPIRTKQTLKFLVDETWDLPDESKTQSFNAFDFSEVSNFADNIYTREFSYQTKVDNIKPTEFRKAMAALKDINESTWVTLTITDAEEPSAQSYDFGGFVDLAIGLILIFSIILAIGLFGIKK